MRIVSLIMVGYFLVVPSAVMAQTVSQEAVVPAERTLAEQLVRQDLDAFVVFSRLDFEQRVDEAFVPNKAIFVNSVEGSFLSDGPQEVAFTLNEVMLADGKVIAAFHWMKKTVDAAGKPVLTEGDASIVYIQRDDQWLIYQVQGDSPFTS